MIAACWLFSYGMQLPTLLGEWGRFGYDSRLQTCSIMTDDHGHSSKTTLFITAFVIPCLVIIACYAKIFWVVHKSEQRLKRHATKQNSIPNNLRPLASKIHIQIEVHVHVQVQAVGKGYRQHRVLIRHVISSIGIRKRQRYRDRMRSWSGFWWEHRAALCGRQKTRCSFLRRICTKTEFSASIHRHGSHPKSGPEGSRRQPSVQNIEKKKKTAGELEKLSKRKTKESQSSNSSNNTHFYCIQQLTSSSGNLVICVWNGRFVYIVPIRCCFLTALPAPFRPNPLDSFALSSIF